MRWTPATQRSFSQRPGAWSEPMGLELARRNLPPNRSGRHVKLFPRLDEVHTKGATATLQGIERPGAVAALRSSERSDIRSLVRGCVANVVPLPKRLRRGQRVPRAALCETTPPATPIVAGVAGFAGPSMASSPGPNREVGEMPVHVYPSRRTFTRGGFSGRQLGGGCRHGACAGPTKVPPRRRYG